MDIAKLKAARAELTDSLRFLDEAIERRHLDNMIAGTKAVHVDADELYKVGTGRDVVAVHDDLRRRYHELRAGAARLLRACTSGKTDPEAERVVHEHAEREELCAVCRRKPRWPGSALCATCGNEGG